MTSEAIDLSRKDFRNYKEECIRLQKELDRYKQEFHTLVENLPDVVFRLDCNLRHIFISPVVERITGIPWQDFLGRTGREVGLPAEICDRFEAKCNEAIATRQVTQVEFDFEGKYYQSRIIPQPASDGSISSVMGITEDITERKQAENALRESEALLTALLNSSPVAIAFLDQNLRYVHINEALAAMNGIPVREHLGRTVEEVLPGWAPIFTPVLQQVMQSREPLLNQEINGETNPPGLLRHSLVDYYPVCLPDGQLLGVGVSAIDITHLKQIEAELRLANQRFELATTAVNCLVYDWDLERGTVERSNGLIHILGYSPEEVELTSEWWSAQIHPEDLPRANAEFAAAVAKGDRYAIECRIRHKNNQYVYVQDQGLVVSRSANGQPTRIVGSTTDISDRKRNEAERLQAEAKLRESENRYRTLANAVSQLMWINEPDGRIEFFNDRWKEYTGAALELGVGLWREVIHPDDFESTLATRTEAIQAGEAYEVECRLKRFDQTYRWHLARVVPLKNDQGDILYWFGTATDIEEIKQVEAGQRFLAESSSVLATSLDYQTTLTSIARSAVPFLADCCFFDVVTADNQIQRVACHHVDPEKQAWFEQVRQYIPPHKSEHHPVAKVLLSGDTTFIPYVSDEWLQAIALNPEHLQFMQDYQPCSVMAVPLTVHNQRLGVLTFCFTAASGRHYTQADIALAEELAHRAALALDNAKLYQQAQEANRVKDEFLAVLSHELRSPLNAILGWAKLLRSRQFNEATTTCALETIERNARLQTQLIEDLLDISRILQGKFSLNVCPVNLVTCIEAAIETMRLAAEAKSIHIQFSFSPSVGLVAGDPNRLQQIVWNLLSNAIKFTPAGGHVHIWLEAIGSEAQIQVSDTGKGITPDFLPYIFDHFRQADASITRSYGGLGLGLAIVRQLVELHGGSVYAESMGEGQGATFTVKLPLLADEMERKDELASNPTSHSSMLADRRILIVDDDPDTREFFSFVIEDAGAIALTVTSAREALVALPQFQPDLLMSDIGMPEEDGYSLLRQVRQLSPAQGGLIPAIALTAYASEEDRNRALIAGYQAHLSKPIEPAVLVEAIAQLLTSH
ncbi:PAS domain S-box protein [Leptolyngbya sp. FACHB-541]|nr:PAS domain S-box protein [Leptolyngbya sp. FACHB-541]